MFFYKCGVLFPFYGILHLFVDSIWDQGVFPYKFFFYGDVNELQKAQNFGIKPSDISEEDYEMGSGYKMCVSFRLWWFMIMKKENGMMIPKDWRRCTKKDIMTIRRLFLMPQPKPWTRTSEQKRTCKYAHQLFCTRIGRSNDQRNGLLATRWRSVRINRKRTRRKPRRLRTVAQYRELRRVFWSNRNPKRIIVTAPNLLFETFGCFKFEVSGIHNF